MENEGSSSEARPMESGSTHGKQDKKDSWTCNYCGNTLTAAIQEMKQNIDRGLRNCTDCPECPVHVRAELQALMKAKATSQIVPDESQYDDDDCEEEVDCENLGVKRKRTMDLFVAKKKGQWATSGEIVEVYKACDMAIRDKACAAIARFFYDAGIAFSAATYPGFQAMIESIGQYGPKMKGPSMHEIRVPLLKNEVEAAHKEIEVHKKNWMVNGCSIILDGWHDEVVQKDIVNILVNYSRGTTFVKSMDVSEIVKDSTLLFQLLDNMVEEVGEKNVIQVVTDNTPNYVMAGKLLMTKRPNLYWTPCAAHCVDLMLEDIGKLVRVKSALKKCMFMNGYIYGHISLVNMMRRFTNQRNLYRPAITRCATSFITLAQYFKQKDNLKKMVTSQEWMDSKWPKQTVGKKIASFILQDSFWRNVLYALKLGGPLIEVLRMVEGERKSPLGFIYEAIDRVKEAIAKSFSMKKDYTKAFEIIDKRWDCQLHGPLHAAGYYLNPQFQYDNPASHCARVMDGLYKCIARLIPDIEAQDKVILELEKFRKAEGLFGIPMAIRQRSKQSPAEWWILCGASTPNLQNFAGRVLSLTCTATRCERNSGIFQHIHSKKRNRLTQTRLVDMVFVKNNRALKRRYESPGTMNSIFLDDIDETNEWLHGRTDTISSSDDDEVDDLVFDDGDNLTWDVFPRVSRANDSSSVKCATSSGWDVGSSSKLDKSGGKASIFTCGVQVEDDEDEIEEDIGVDDPYVEDEEDEYGGEEF